MVASKLFGIALFCSGQSSTLTGTMAGQIIMEGFLNIRIQPWLRRLVTRLLAIVPAFVVIWISGNNGTLKLLILSQVVLNLQLPFAIVPLLHFTNDRQRMGPFASGLWLRLGGWATAVIVVGLNLWLGGQTIHDWVQDSGRWAPLVWTVCLSVSGGLLWLLAWITVQPYRRPRPGPRRWGSSRLRPNCSASANTGAFWCRSTIRISTASRSATRRAWPSAIMRRSICCTSK